MAKKVKVDKELCTLCGLCTSICPDVFDIGDECAVVKLDPVPDEYADACQEAIDSCPDGAISMTDA
ncbi:MAG: ferredoxin [SAR324 cluster bacterium]|uniref:Ferredoxin n=1 Tax=SAR324 cluster bacterium TaxID=2024889 RepID=A0A7X9IJC7_9DELT|nr:ferredoxin [SAR324 cluster bacterium]